MLPNRFPDADEPPEYNAVDASLWYVVAVHDFRAAWKAAGKPLPARDERALDAAVEAILTGYAGGTRYGIHADADGLLAAGVPGIQLTWMDARIGERVVTPRIGKPVEVQALWLNALRIGSAVSERWASLLARAEASFTARFWNEDRGCLHDVVDVDHVAGTADPTLRPNQILAVGGLPFPCLDGERARRVVETVERHLWTPLGLRSLAPGEPGYAPHYAGGPAERDGAYHQGTVWPWLLGPFVEAVVRVRGDTAAERLCDRSTYLDPLLSHLDVAGIGHLPEVADAEPPHRAGGCPFQAWSVGEALRIDRVVLREG
jgi:predicted glycogen debranching enzyme